MTKLEGFKKEKQANLHTGTCAETKQLVNDLQITNHPETSYSFSNFLISSSQFEAGNNQQYVQ